MNLNFKAPRRKPLLACVSSPFENSSHAAEEPERVRANVQSLIELWEKREAPCTHVRQKAPLRARKNSENGRLERAGDLIFEPVSFSLLQNLRFRNFYSDIGNPPIMLVGSDLETTILVTAVDSFLSKIPLCVVADAVSLSDKGKNHDKQCLVYALSNFVTILQTGQLQDDG